MNAILLQSCQLVSVTECASSHEDNAEGMNWTPFVNMRPALNSLAINHLPHPCDHTQTKPCCPTAYDNVFN